MDASEYKHVVLGLMFLKYISDAFEQHRAILASNPEADPDDRDEYLGDNVFWVPPDARWERLRDKARRSEIGAVIDKAMIAIERENRALKDVLPHDYARPQLDPMRLGQIVDLISTVGLGDDESRKSDVLGRVYEYFLGRFASAEGRSGGEFYTPRSVVRLLVEMIEPYKGRVFDPACGSGGMFVQSEDFVTHHGGNKTDISIFGQESNHTTWRLAKMNLSIRGIEAKLSWNAAGSFHRDAHPDLKADFVLANPPFNDADWGGDKLQFDKRWRFGPPPPTSANYAWIQHFIHHLAPDGYAGFVMANGALSSMQNGEDKIREALIKGGLVDCIVALPLQLFYTTPIPASLWILARNRRSGTFRPREDETLFIDAKRMGYMLDRTHRDLDDNEIQRIVDTYHAFRSRKGSYADVPGFCAAVKRDVMAEHGYRLTPSRYVGLRPDAERTETLEVRAARIRKSLEQTFRRSRDLMDQVLKEMQGLRTSE